ncbi:MAG: hypothetical protein IJD63_02525 [Oscillospiraceae bacterium]|nr:hypothetical protein [Oscillospiraceae bacterium]
MVKGISKQIIVVDAPEPKLFEQAIFILKEDTPGITDEALLKEAKHLLHAPREEKPWQGAIWALCGGLTVGIAWLMSLLL